MLHYILALLSHIAVLGVLAMCCKNRNKTSTTKHRSNAASGPRTPLSGAAAAAPSQPMSPPPSTTAPPPTTATNTPSTNPSSGQPVSSSPVKSPKRRDQAVAGPSAVLKASSVVTSSNAEDDMVSQTGKKKAQGSPKQRLPDEEMVKGKPAAPQKKPAGDGRKKASEKTGDDTRKLEQKTQKGGGEAAEPTKDLLKVERSEKKKKGTWFSRDRIKKKLGMKSDDSPKATPTTTPTKPDAPKKVPPNWHDVVPESQIEDELTDFDVTKHTQDPKRNPAMRK